MRRIAVALSKGGVGKTTTAVNLAAGLAQQGRRVLLIDMDTQGQVAKMLGIQPKSGIAEVINGEKPLDEVSIEARPGLWVLPGGRALASLKRTIDRKEFGGERTVDEALVGLDGAYDYAIVDTAPGWDVITVNALFFAREVLAPVALEAMALEGLSDFTHSLRSIQRYHKELQLHYVVPTFMDRRVRKSEMILQQLNDTYANELCTPIRYNVRLSEAPGAGQTIFEYAASSPGADDYIALTERILKDE
ncbi:MAG: ParA family protein [Anaerolineales bacterium]|nr:ParA family protein [Anaerolineales bacterium]